MKSGLARIGHDITPEVAERQCFGKKVFTNRNEARDNAARFRKNPGVETRSTYKCCLCGGFHVTSVPKEYFAALRRSVRR